MPFRYTYTIAGLTLRFDSPQEMTVTDSFRPFRSEASPDYRIVLEEVSALPEPVGAPLYESTSYTVFPDGCGGYLRFFRDAMHGNTPYAVTAWDWETRRVTIFHLPEGRSFLRESGSCFFHIAWETILLREHRMMLHAACVDTPLGGILFSGPSGVGKSTQADLWCRHAGGRLLNGDRTILRPTDREWQAWGSPYAGSSRCYVNGCCPVAAVVVLEQARTCTLRRLPAAESFQRVFAGLTVNSWDPAFVTAACDFAQDLTARIPVYRLSCTPAPEAVDLLRTALEKGDAP